MVLWIGDAELRYQLFRLERDELHAYHSEYAVARNRLLLLEKVASRNNWVLHLPGMVSGRLVNTFDFH